MTKTVKDHSKKALTAPQVLLSLDQQVLQIFGQPPALRHHCPPALNPKLALLLDALQPLRQPNLVLGRHLGWDGWEDTGLMCVYMWK